MMVVEKAVAVVMVPAQQLVTTTMNNISVREATEATIIQWQ